jgi:hypothetical protein
VVSGGIEATFDRCPRLELSIDGTEVISVRTVRLFTVCFGVSRDGLVLFDLRSSDFQAATTLPRRFAIADAEVDFELVADDTVNTTTVTGDLRGPFWRSIP